MKHYLMLLAVGCTLEPITYPGPNLLTASQTATVDSTAVGTTEPTTTPTTSTTTATTPTLAFTGDVPRNILWISIDTLRKDVFPRYSGEAWLSFLGERMAEGVILDDALQCTNWTWAGTACGMTGAYNVEHQYIPRLSANEEEQAPDEITYLSEVLLAEGWQTHIVTTNGWIKPRRNNAQGNITHQHAGGARASRAFELGTETLNTLDGKDPWFLHIHLYDPHAPYNPPEKYLGGLEGLPEVEWDLSIRDQHYEARDQYYSLDVETQNALRSRLEVRYQAELTYMDDMLRDAWQTLDEQGHLDDTLVVLWNDHGEQFWEHGLHTHAWSLYQGENDAVVFFWAKNIVPNVDTSPTSVIDIAPTILDLHGVDIPESMTGLPVGTAPQDRVRYSGASARLGVVQSVTRGSERGVFYWRTGAFEVTDSVTDPGRNVNIFNPASAQTQELWELMKPYVYAADPLLAAEPTWPEGMTK